MMRVMAVLGMLAAGCFSVTTRHSGRWVRNVVVDGPVLMVTSCDVTATTVTHRERGELLPHTDETITADGCSSVSIPAPFIEVPR